MKTDMDFWSRLIGGAGASSPSKQAYFNDPQQRLGRFKRIHDQLLQLWRTQKSLSCDPAAAETVRLCIEGLNRMLENEIQAPAPHLCIDYVATSKIYTVVAKLASASYNESIIRETLDLSNTLVETEEGNFLEDQRFATALTAFVDAISTTITLSVETECIMLEALFGIAAKLRLQPGILPAWFRPETQDLGDVISGNPEGVPNPRAHKQGFPLFYLLLDYVHHEGKVGDFARTGLLYITETAIHSEKLERWIVESDLATLMASGLGALYSQLSRKLVISFRKDSIPAIVAFSEVTRLQPPLGAELSSSEAFQAHLSTFLSYLIFWQDILEHCSSDDIKQSLLDHFEYLFLQQLLYPSLMESSDVDGGSAVAVLSYLRCILESIHQPELVRLILQYLFALPKEPPEDLSKARPTTLVRRRKSEILVNTLAAGDEKPAPNLFTLVDLILTSLQSRNQQTVTATLRLISVILRNHHQRALSTLIRISTKNLRAKRTIETHDRTLDWLLSIAEDLAASGDLEASYDTHLRDAHALLESHSCSAHFLSLPSTKILTMRSRVENEAFKKPHMVEAHTIMPEDPLLKSLLLLFTNFLHNEIETNLSLTQALSTLASCGYTRLEGWLISSVGETATATYSAVRETSSCSPDETTILQSPHLSASDDDGTTNPRVSDQSLGNLKPESSSPVSAVFQALLDQIEVFRREVQDFDTYLAERRHVFKVGEEIDNALAENPVPSRRSEDSKAASPTRTREVAPIGSISQRLLSDTVSAGASRSSSPRGRQRNDPPMSALAGRLSHLQVPPSPSPSHPASRAYSPSPLRKDSFSSSPPRFTNAPMGPADALRRKIKMTPRLIGQLDHVRDIGSSETSSVRSESVGPASTNAVEPKEISITHLLTNVIILQEFMLELAAIVRVRASLFDEVNFNLHSDAWQC